MNLQSFSIKYGFPIATTARYVRQMVGEELDRRTGDSIPLETEIELAGVRVLGAGSTRCQYEVVNPTDLAIRLVLLSEGRMFPFKAIGLLASAARLAHQAACQVHPTIRLYEGNSLFRPNAEYWESVGWALKLAAAAGE